jgi:Flp pilus assembly protein TadD
MFSVLAKLPVFFLALLAMCAVPASAGEGVPPQRDSTDFLRHQALTTEFLVVLRDVKPTSDPAGLMEFDIPALHALEMGYRSVPWVSEELIAVAKEAIAIGRKAEGAQFANKAVELSPGDPKTLFSAGVTTLPVQPGSAMRYLFRGVLSVPSHPALAARLCADLLLVLMSGAALAGFLMCVFLFVMHREKLLVSSASFLPPRWQGWASPFLLAVPLLVSIGFGYAATLAVLAVCVHRGVRRYRMLPVLIGGILLAWPLALTVSGKLKMKAAFSVDSLLSAVNSASFFTELSPIASYVLQKRADDLPARSAYAVLLLRDGKSAEAEKALREVLSMTEDPVLTRVALTNLGAALIAQKRFREAKDALLQAGLRGESSFEFYHLRALAALSLTETAEHTELYSAAGERNPELLSMLEKMNIQDSAIVTAALPARLFYWRLPGNWGWQGSVPNAVQREREAAVLESLLWRGSPNVFFALGGALMFLPLFRGRRAVRLPGERDAIFRLSLLSGVFPGTWSIAQGALVLGWSALTVFFSCLLAGVESPVPMEAFHALQLSPRVIFGSLAVLLFAASFLSARRRLFAESSGQSFRRGRRP